MKEESNLNTYDDQIRNKKFYSNEENKDPLPLNYSLEIVEESSSREQTYD